MEANVCGDSRGESMSDIKQAAKWMQEGKRVRRPRLDRTISIGKIEGWIRVYVRGVVRPLDMQESAPFGIEDLIAEDWEIAE
jgi:hypothetical protein